MKNELRVLWDKLEKLEDDLSSLQSQLVKTLEVVHLAFDSHVKEEQRAFLELRRELNSIHQTLNVLVRDYRLKEEQHIYHVFNSLEIGVTQKYPM